MYGKIEISGRIKLLTGMHIGASDSFAAIGAIDTPVIKDPISGLPLIPGSSLKGKMRTLLAKQYNPNPFAECERDDEKITRLFGSSKSVKNGYPVSARILFSDVVMENLDEIKAHGVESPTEAKEENAINRVTGIANPRVIERVIKGAAFPLSIIYNVENEEEMAEDFKTIADGLKLLQYDYIGGHGSRGYGRIAISDLHVDVVVGDVKEELLNQCEAIIEEI